MAMLSDIRTVALSLPQAREVRDRHGIWFNVGKKTFALRRDGDGRWIMKLPKPRQEFLFAVRPEVFAPYRAGALEWAYVDVAHLSPDEAAVLVREAWATVAPKKLVRAFTASSD